MAVLDTLEKMTGIDIDVTDVSVAKEFITAGDNFKSKTILPFTKYTLGVSFLERLGTDIDTEFEEIIQIHNLNRIETIKSANPNFKVSEKTFRYDKLSDVISVILNETMLLMPSNEGKAREQLENVLRWLREEKSKQQKPDSLTQIQQYLQR